MMVWNAVALLGPTSGVTIVQFYNFKSVKLSQYLKCLVNIYNNVFNILWKYLKKFETSLMGIEYPKTFF